MFPDAKPVFALVRGGGGGWGEDGGGWGGSNQREIKKSMAARREACSVCRLIERG